MPPALDEPLSFVATVDMATGVWLGDIPDCSAGVDAKIMVGEAAGTVAVIDATELGPVGKAVPIAKELADEDILLAADD